MKFLFLAPRYHPNYYYRIKSLINHNHKVVFLSLYELPPERHDILKPEILGWSKIFLFLNKFFNKHKRNKLKSRFELRFGFPPILKFLFKFLKYNPDVVVVKNIESAYSLLGLFFGRIFFKKNLVFLQIEKYRVKPKSYSVDLAGKVFGAKVITPLPGDRKFRNKNRNLFYIPFIQKAYDFNKQYFKDNKINIINIGKFVKRKEQLLLIKAVKEIVKEFPVRLTLIGQEADSQYLSLLKKYIKDNDLESVVTFKFNLPWVKIAEEYKMHDLFVLPSYSEPAPISPLEAMSFKLPVIVSDDNGVKCYIKEGENGYIFRQGNLEDLIKKIKLIIDNKENIIKMGKASSQLIKDIHSPDKFYNSFINLVNNNEAKN